MCLFHLFSPGKVNFVHWCVLGLTCTQQTFVTQRTHCIKEASVGKDGSQLMKGDPPRKSASQEHRWGVGEAEAPTRFSVVNMVAAEALTEKCCFGTVDLSVLRTNLRHGNAI